MSIIKNDNNIYHTNVTIMRLPKDVALSSPPLPTGHPLAGTYIVKKAIEINNTFYQMYWYSAGGETVRIKCELNENAEGVIYGHTNRRIIKVIDGTGNWIRWMNGDTVEAQVAWDNNIHVIGYQGSEEDWLNGGYCTPYYDGQLIAPSVHNTSYQMSYYPNLGALTNTNAAISSSDTWAMRIYEAIAYSYYFSSYTAKVRYMYHVYAAQAVNGSSPCLIETRCKLQGSFRKMPASGEVHNVAINFGEDEDGYGVQLDDMSFITGNKYHDLLGCIANDGGIDTVSGWTEDTADTPYKISNKDFAFYLPTIPVKNETGTRTTRQGYIEGELIRGRKPQWSIWNDAVKFGKYAVAQSGAPSVVRFNIFKKNNGDSVTRFEMLNFDGYNQANDYPPLLQWRGDIDLEYHNGVPCTLTKDNVLTLGNYDELSVFAMDIHTDTETGVVRIGNLALWNYTQNEQYEDAGLDKLRCIGGGMLLRSTDVGSTVGWRTIGSLIKTTWDTGDTYESGGRVIPKSLSSDLLNGQSQEAVSLFRTDGMSLAGFFRNDMGAMQYMRDEIEHYGSRNLKVDIALVRSTDARPDTDDFLDCSKLVPSQYGKLHGVFDNIARKGYDVIETDIKEFDRMVVGEQDGIADIGSMQYLIGIQGTGGFRYQQAPVSNSSLSVSMGYALAVGFALKSKNSDSLLTMFGTGATSVFGFAEVTEESKTVTDKTSSITASTVIVDEDEFDKYSLTIDKNFLSCTARSLLSDDEITKSVENGTVTFVSHFIIPPSGMFGQTHTDKICCIITDKSGRQTEFYYQYTVTGNPYGGSQPNVVVSINIIVENPDSNSAKISFIPVIREDGEMQNPVYPDDEDMSARMISNRHVTGRMFGFTKPVKNDSTDEQIQSQYAQPFVYDPDYYPYFQQGNVSPWDLSADRSGGEMGALFFMWKDLNLSRNINSVRPTNPFTAHIRLFSAASGPFAWNVYNDDRYFDSINENPYLQRTDAGGIKTIMFHNEGTLLYDDHSATVNFVDAMITLWSKAPENVGASDQITSADALNGRTVRIYKEPLHEPKDSTNTPTLLVSFSISGMGPSVKSKTFSASGSDGKTYNCFVTADVTYGGFSRLPGGTWRQGEYNKTGFYHIEVYSGTENNPPTPGTMYYIDIV